MRTQLPDVLFLTLREAELVLGISEGAIRKAMKRLGVPHFVRPWTVRRGIRRRQAILPMATVRAVQADQETRWRPGGRQKGQQSRRVRPQAEATPDPQGESTPGPIPPAEPDRNRRVTDSE